MLFAFTTGLGVIAVIAGVGGGVLYVPIVSALFPFHLDFVRGAGLIVALAGAISAAPKLLKSGLASLRLALPFALMGSIGSIGGAVVGLALPESTIRILLGTSILGIVVVMFVTRRNPPAVGTPSDSIARYLGISGEYIDESTNERVDWSIHRTPIGLALFVGVGFLGGMFGLGAGWANVPMLNILLSAPIKISVATSGLIIAVNGTAATWVYLHNGAVLPLIAIPSVAGIMIGTRIGARLLSRVKPKSVKIAVILILLIAGLRQFLDGIGVTSS